MFVSPSAIPSFVASVRCVTRESASTASSNLRSRWASTSMWCVVSDGLYEIGPGHEAVLVDRVLGDATDHVVQPPRRNAGAGALGPDIVGADRGAGGDRPDRNDAVMRHVPHVLLARL